MGDRWRLRPTWTADGEPKEFAPSFTRTRWGARRLERDLNKRFAHFNNFAVLVDRLPAELAGANQRELPSLDAPAWPKTTHCAADEFQTLCGEPLAVVSGHCSPDWFISKRRKTTKSWVDCDECTRRFASHFHA